jgi:hypothetical protein
MYTNFFSDLFLVFNHRIIIINFWPTHIYLNELADSVKPGGDLINTVAEVGIYAINPKVRGAVKRIMPLRIAVSAHWLHASIFL